ncbi:phosphoribosylanthranilate isomerase [Sutcliffiella rhizosphaerae]|uniref:N-(5'-phosphoribosyl)anthranilate isomerase n=1 Tax=Sutcliffiella rhizosphaerae TaxID=2880967 RepID=A0ABN8ABS2_9BACI|nr:phosphoribosylanthranilate isomerase [Sutcliffiella rhizosphaerae]CAG9622650.1 N-(5'-phosphoribosyl)anthranilate isomerase [Sutcliffiella rhizosphaerae]
MSNTLLKYCGNKTLLDYQISLQSNADYIGFVFAASKRRVCPVNASNWVEMNPPGKKKLVGVFVNQPIEEMIDTAQRVGLDVIQCHGDENVDFMRRLRSRFTGEIWKVIHHKNEDSVYSLVAFQGLITAVIVDKKIGNQYGGTGTSFDWSYIPAYLKVSKSLGIPCIIAGGVNDETINELLFFQPDGVDISTGIESNFRKDKRKMTLIESMVKNHGKQRTS